MKEDINALDELSKGCSMGINALNFVMDIVEDKNFKDNLKIENDKYKDMINNIKNVYKKYNEDDTPHEINLLEKTMTWWGIEMRTFNDNSNSKIAELLIKGTNMGIIEGRKILNNKNLNEEVTKIASDYVKMQEDSLEMLKKWL